MSTATLADAKKAAKFPKRELDATTLHQEQPSTVAMPADAPFERPDSTIEALDGTASLDQEYADALAFMEEPVEVYFHDPQLEFAARWVDCFSNGKGIECRKIDNQDFGRWVEMKQVPTGRNVTIKRKYLEILARCKEMKVRTKVTEVPGQDPINEVLRSQHLKHPFNVVTDTPKGHEWLRRVLAGL